MKPTMKSNKSSTAAHTTTKRPVSKPSIREEGGKRATLDGRVRKPKACCPRAPAQQQHSLARRSTRGEAGIRGHEMIGKYRTEITSSQGKRCGVFALEISTATQLLHALTPGDWDRLFGSAASRAWHADRGWVGPDYEREFHDEQLGLVLYLWGCEHGRTLQLGVAADGQEPFVLPLPELLDGRFGEKKKADGERETVWIHNDNAQVIMGRLCNHYSGITILGPLLA